MMKPEEIVETLKEHSTGFVLLCVDRTGEVVSATSEIPLTVSLVGASRSMKPKQILDLVEMLQFLNKTETKNGRGRQRKPRKQAPEKSPAEPDPAQQ